MMRRQRGAERQAMGYQYVVVRSVLPQTRLELVDLATQFVMCLRELQAERDCTVAVVGSHGWRPFDSAPPCLTQSATGTRCCHYPIMSMAESQARPAADAQPHLGMSAMSTLRQSRSAADADTAGVRRPDMIPENLLSKWCRIRPESFVERARDEPRR